MMRVERVSIYVNTEDYYSCIKTDINTTHLLWYRIHTKTRIKGVINTYNFLICN